MTETRAKGLIISSFSVAFIWTKFRQNAKFVSTVLKSKQRFCAKLN